VGSEMCIRDSQYTAIIRDIMCSAANLSVPLIVDIGTGNNWDEAH